MPNNVTNELVFSNISTDIANKIRAVIFNNYGKVDFQILVPSPVNIWRGGVETKHSQTFPNTLMNWATNNWGTKWNAYGAHSMKRKNDDLVIVFDTAWSPPYGWLVALFNTLETPFQHNWLSEGDMRGNVGTWTYDDSGKLGAMGPMQWNEQLADDKMQKHLNVLRWGHEDVDAGEL